MYPGNRDTYWHEYDDRENEFKLQNISDLIKRFNFAGFEDVCIHHVPYTATEIVPINDRKRPTDQIKGNVLFGN